MSEYHVVDLPIAKNIKVRSVWGTKKPKPKHFKKMGLKPGDMFHNYINSKQYILSITGRWIKIK